MAGNSNSGNRSARRGHPLAIRVRLTESNARRLRAIAAPVENVTTATNDIIEQWLDEHYPEPDEEERMNEIALSHLDALAAHRDDPMF